MISKNTMKVILDIQEGKVPFIMELLKNFKFVKVKQVKSDKEDVLDGLSEAVSELNQIKVGEEIGIPAKDLLDDL